MELTSLIAPCLVTMPPPGERGTDRSGGGVALRAVHADGCVRR